MPSFEFNKTTRTYFKDGRPVKAEVLRQWVSDVLERVKAEYQSITQRRLNGELNRAAWTLEMRSVIAKSEGAIAMLAQGGKEAMDSASWGRVGQRVRDQLDYLRGYERDVANDKAGTDAQQLWRAGKYADNLNISFAAEDLAGHKSNGVTRVLRVLGQPKTEHCDGPGNCEELAGEYDIEDVPAIGDSPCGSACNCEIIPLEKAA